MRSTVSGVDADAERDNIFDELGEVATLLGVEALGVAAPDVVVDLKLLVIIDPSISSGLETIVGAILLATDGDAPDVVDGRCALAAKLVAPLGGRSRDAAPTFTGATGVGATRRGFTPTSPPLVLIVTWRFAASPPMALTSNAPNSFAAASALQLSASPPASKAVAKFLLSDRTAPAFEPFDNDGNSPSSAIASLLVVFAFVVGLVDIVGADAASTPRPRLELFPSSSSRIVARTPDSARDAARSVTVASAAMSCAPSAAETTSSDALARMRSRSWGTFGFVSRRASSAVVALALAHARRMSPGEWCDMCACA
jgi:hypothetical protein